MENDIALQLAVFVIIVGSGNLYYSRKRKHVIKEVNEHREKLSSAIKNLHDKV